MKKIINIVLGLSLLMPVSCLRLDSNLYNLSDKITEYKLDDYSGEKDFVLDASYDIPDSMIHIFTIPSHDVKANKDYDIYAIYIGDQTRIATDTVILYCHGNKWHMDFYWQRAKLLAHTGGKMHYGVMYLDYRGYGLSKGTPTEEGLYEDVDAAMQWLKSKGLSNNRLMIYGFSMGSAPATELTANARTLTPQKLILEAPFASADVMAADGSGLDMPGSYVTNLSIDNAEEIKKVNQPFCWIHGTQDLFLNIKTHGEVVYKNYHGVFGEAHRIEGAGHSSVPNTWGYLDYLQTLHAFITRK